MRCNSNFLLMCTFALFVYISLELFLNYSPRNFFQKPETNITLLTNSIDMMEAFLKLYANNTSAQNSISEEGISDQNPPTQELIQRSESPTAAPVAPCPSVPIVSVLDGGRLGNKIWEYAAVWSLARLLGRPGYVPQSILTSLSKVFANLSVPAIEEIEHCGVHLGEPVEKWNLRPLDKVADRFRGRHLLLQKWILLPEPVLLFRRLLHKEFHFLLDIQRQVEETIEDVGGRGKVLVGIHVRRTDFAKFLPRVYHTKLVGDEYFKKAMQWFRDNVSGPLLFLIVSDDLKWCRKFLLVSDDVVIASKSPAHDLALMASSNHTIIDYGTFGDWGALMAGGHTISLNVDKYFNKQMAKYNNWHVFGTEELTTEFSKSKQKSEFI